MHQPVPPLRLGFRDLDSEPEGVRFGFDPNGTCPILHSEREGIVLGGRSITPDDHTREQDVQKCGASKSSHGNHGVSIDAARVDCALVAPEINP